MCVCVCVLVNECRHVLRDYFQVFALRKSTSRLISHGTIRLRHGPCQSSRVPAAPDSRSKCWHLPLQAYVWGLFFFLLLGGRVPHTTNCCNRAWHSPPNVGKGLVVDRACTIDVEWVVAGVCFIAQMKFNRRSRGIPIGRIPMAIVINFLNRGMAIIKRAVWVSGTTGKLLFEWSFLVVYSLRLRTILFSF